MGCKELKGLVSPYIDNELSEKERKLFEAHLKECGACSAMYEETFAVHHPLAGLERLKAPYGFSTRVLANVEARKAGRFQWIPLLSRVAVTAGVLIMVGIGIVSGSFLGKSFSFQKTGSFMSLFSLDAFNAAPPDSLGGIYLAMTEEGNERQ